jgi:hypothetical protein
MMKSIFLAILLSTTVTAFSQEAKPLTDGKTLAGWVKADGQPLPSDTGWEVVDGVIHRKGKSGDIFTAKEYANFEFEWDWKISSGGNSGVKYRVTLYGKELLGPEYQMLDDDKHVDGKLLTHKTGCIYDLFPTIDNKPVKPVGEWNHSKIVANGGKFEHWLNGTKVAECDTTTPAWKAAVAKSKFKSKPDWALNPKGKIMLQDHGDEVWFRNLTIKEL